MQCCTSVCRWAGCRVQCEAATLLRHCQSASGLPVPPLPPLQTIMGVESMGGLRVLAINTLGKFLQNKDNK